MGGDLTRRIELTPDKLVARGKMHLLYNVAAFPGCLIRVVNPERVDAAGEIVGGKYGRGGKLRRRHGFLLTLRREMTEQLMMLKRRPVHDAAQWPIVRIYGLVDTSLGCGAVVEKLEDGRGGLAPTLAALVRASAFTEAHRGALDRFFDALKENHICVGDLHEKNIVFAGDATSGRFVAADGYGQKAVIPLADWSYAFNARQVERWRRRAFDFIEKAGSPKR
jgi:hypothetical protein